MIISCKDKNTIDGGNFDFQSDQNILGVIDNWQDLKLIQTDDRFGEWGGNTYIIRIYKNSNSELFADYKELKGSIEPPPPPPFNDSTKYLPWYSYKPLIDQKNHIKLKNKQIHLILDAISGLSKQRLSNENFSHSGIMNEVILKDSSIYIRDYPSYKWVEFQKLKKWLTKKCRVGKGGSHP